MFCAYFLTSNQGLLFVYFMMKFLHGLLAIPASRLEPNHYLLQCIMSLKQPDEGQQMHSSQLPGAFLSEQNHASTSFLAKHAP